MDGGILVDGFGLIAGLHRLEAVKSLGNTEIEVHVVELDALHRQLAEVDENLCGTKLSPAERALFTKRRKEIYLALYPETRKGVAQANGSNKAQGKGHVSEISAFTSDTATKTNVSRRTVEMEAARGDALSDDIQAIVGTSLDSGVELDALAKLEHRLNFEPMLS